MEEKRLVTNPLTLKELGEMLVRHPESTPMAMVIKAAMQRRLSEPSKEFG